MKVVRVVVLALFLAGAGCNGDFPTQPEPRSLELAAPPVGSGRPFSTALTGAAEVPAGDPDGSGTALLSVNPGEGSVCWAITWDNIAAPTAAHIHIAPAGVAGPVVVPLSPIAGGCTTASRLLLLGIIKNPSVYYVNVHNAEFPAGAIRGQLSG